MDQTEALPAASPDASKADLRRNAQRAALLDAASEMLLRGGPDSISLRKLATKVGTSTMAVYTAFGGKDGLIAALFDEAFDRLGDAQSAVPKNDEPLLYLADLGRAYHEFARQNPSYYALMISATMPVSEAARHAHSADTILPARGISGHSSYQFLLDGVTACIKDGSFSDEFEPILVADAFWAVVHGLCSLELAGFHATADEAKTRFAVTTLAVIRGFMTDKGRAKLESYTRGA
ncbi:MAG: TetR/AcrR family transcriptional regulator [Parvibaculum sp.]|nr:TetR/AcrR family transcriptional regulator [Parvibaculum sp.]